MSCDGGKQSRERSCVLTPISGKDLIYIPILTFMSVRLFVVLVLSYIPAFVLNGQSVGVSGAEGRAR